MKSQRLCGFFLVFWTLACVPSGLAQGCGVVMTRNYSSYQSASTDGAKIYTSVLVDGSASRIPLPLVPATPLRIPQRRTT